MALSPWRPLSPTAAIAGAGDSWRWHLINLSAFSERDRIPDVDARIAHGACDLDLPKQDLHGPVISGLLVNQCSLCAPQ